MDDGLSLVSLNEVSRMAHHTTRPSESGDVVVRFGLWGGDGRGRMKRSRGDRRLTFLLRQQTFVPNYRILRQQTPHPKRVFDFGNL